VICKLSSLEEKPFFEHLNAQSELSHIIDKDSSFHLTSVIKHRKQARISEEKHPHLAQFALNKILKKSRAHKLIDYENCK